jgi:hypothetical protein
MHSNVFNYSFVTATIIAAAGLAYCIGRTWIGSKPSLAADTARGVVIGAGILALSYLLVAMLSERYLNSTAEVFLLVAVLIVSLSTSCVIIIRCSRRCHSGLGASVLAVSYGLVSTPAVGLWLGMTLTALLVRGPQ